MSEKKLTMRERTFILRSKMIIKAFFDTAKKMKCDEDREIVENAAEGILMHVIFAIQTFNVETEEKRFIQECCLWKKD